MAMSGDVWKYINPDLTTPPSQPALPTLPAPADASTIAGHTTLATLTSDERDIYKLLYSEYKEVLSQKKQEIDTLRGIRNHLVTSISKENIVYIESKDTIFEMLVALKKRLAPTDEARKMEVVDKYQRLRQFDKRTDVEAWCKDWEITYADAVALDLPEVSGNRSQNDFAIALSAIDEAYSTAQQFWLRQASKIGSGTAIPSLFDMVEDFRNNYRRNQALKISVKMGAFSASSDEGKGVKANNDSPQKPQKPCLCGMQHRYKKCFYITPSERPQGWRGKETIFRDINRKVETLKNRAGKPLKNWFVTTFKYDGFDNPPLLIGSDAATEPAAAKSLGVFTTRSSFNAASTDDYKLYFSWTLDSASDTHVCNEFCIRSSTERFTWA
ncbi:hypothetical protein K3495_g14231 [Podosphaera aphanis]|nr:hypothetical protein K3495_g14231 [Podosphaera aphanis]